MTNTVKDHQIHCWTMRHTGIMLKEGDWVVPDILQSFVGCKIFGLFFDGYVSLLNDSGKTEITWQRLLTMCYCRCSDNANCSYRNGFWQKQWWMEELTSTIVYLNFFWCKGVCLCAVYKMDNIFLSALGYLVFVLFQLSLSEHSLHFRHTRRAFICNYCESTLCAWLKS